MVAAWQVFFGTDHKRHVEPKEDLRPHRHSIKCWCNPRVDDAGDVAVVVHNSMDRRENHEGKPLG